MKLGVEDDGMISHVSVGRQHLAILTTNGNGTCKKIILSDK